ncbi:unnamed protein product, partial [marine sediment metagenome]
RATHDFTTEVTQEIDREEKASPSQPRQNSEDKSRESSAIGKTQS